MYDVLFIIATILLNLSNLLIKYFIIFILLLMAIIINFILINFDFILIKVNLNFNFTMFIFNQFLVVIIILNYFLIIINFVLIQLINVVQIVNFVGLIIVNLNIFLKIWKIIKDKIILKNLLSFDYSYSILLKFIIFRKFVAKNFILDIILFLI